QATVCLAWLYQFGYGVPRDYGRARKLYQKVTGSGDANAYLGLWWLYLNGLGVPADFREANRWRLNALTPSFVRDLTRLKFLITFDPNYYPVFDLYRRLAETGSGDGLFLLSVAYSNGIGVQQDLKKAFACSQKAAELGLLAAQFDVNTSYEGGIGIDKN